MGNRDRHASAPCGKVRYASKAAVRRALGRYLSRWTIYHCPACDALHVASAKANQARGRVRTTLVRSGDSIDQSRKGGGNG